MINVIRNLCSPIQGSSYLLFENPLCHFVTFPLGKGEIVYGSANSPLTKGGNGEAEGGFLKPLPRRKHRGILLINNNRD